MADTIVVQHGMPPWKPAPDAELVEVYHRYDRPLMGLVRQHDVCYAFTCLLGELDETHLWAYVRVGPEDIEILDRATTETFDGALTDLMERGPLVITAATDEAGIIADTTLEQLVDDISRLARKLIEAFEQHVAKQRETLNEIQGLAATG